MKDHYHIVKWPKGILSTDPVFLSNFSSNGLKFTAMLDWASCFSTFNEAQSALNFCKHFTKDTLEIFKVTYRPCQSEDG